MSRHRSHRSASVSGGDLLVAGIVGVLAGFRTIMVIFLAVVAIGLGMFLYDSYWSSEQLGKSQYSFTASEPVLDEMDGNRPATISPLFNLEWSFRNKSPYLVETAQLNGELYRCDTFDQSLDSCDYVRRENHVVTLTLPAGRHTSKTDQFTFTNTSGKAGIYRAKIWISDVFADTDREY